MQGTYDRLHVPVWAQWRAVVRAAALRLRPYARHDPKQREIRKRFYREMLDAHRRHQELVARWRL